MMKDTNFLRRLTHRRMLQQLMENISDLIYFKDLESRFVFVNRSFARRLGYEKKPEELIDKNDYDFFTEEHASSALADERRVIATGQPVVGIEDKETWPDGRAIWFSTTKLPLRDDDGTIVGTFGISRNISELKERELQMGVELQLAREVQQSFLEKPEMFFPISGGTAAGGSLQVAMSICQADM